METSAVNGYAAARVWVPRRYDAYGNWVFGYWYYSPFPQRSPACPYGGVWVPVEYGTFWKWDSVLTSLLRKRKWKWKTNVA